MFPGTSTRGLQSMPLVADGVLYYTGSYSRVFALDGATGKQLWSYTPELDDALVARQTHSPYNRGAAIGEGKLYVGTVDGRLIALDMKTGKVAWDTKLQDFAKLTVGFTGAPLYAKGTVVIGSQGGEWPGQGPIYGVDAATGKVKWTFNTVGGPMTHPSRAGATIPGAPAAAAAGCRARIEPETNIVYWGTANPAPLYDWSGRQVENRRRPARATISTPRSVLALDIDTGELKVLPSGTAARHLGLRQRVGEFVRWTATANTTSCIRTRAASSSSMTARREGGERLAARAELQLRQEHRSEDRRADRTARLHGRQGSEPLCPAIDGGVSWNSG